MLLNERNNGDEEEDAEDEGNEHQFDEREATLEGLKRGFHFEAP
jgi:hypothetical protein